MRVATARDAGGSARKGGPPGGGEAAAHRAEGSAARLEILYRELGPRLVRVAQRLTRDALAADDVVQAAFEKALRHVADFRGDARMSTWMHRIVVNEALMWLRAERRRRAPQEVWGRVLEVCDPSPTAPEILSRRQRATRVREGLSRLAASDRDVLLSVFVDNQSYKSLAARMAAHPAAVKTRAFRARRRLAVLLQEP